ncbi:response regulator transcription factor [uncultured Piscinibacter sp.]|mgnify:CR=1 FL=1|uniref:response regulator transcription factor n=1 Tax=uncultured Piscinibacter sp. TaxID=1131835 RepID=UPI0026383083|nr:response regulator transcription factor [uncultured Piscinibacter sp.]
MTLAYAPAVRHATTPHAIRVFLAEDHQITMWGLRRLIDSSRPHMEVVGTAASRAELLDHEAAGAADVILLDLDLAGEDSVNSLDELRRRCPGRVLVLTGADDIARHRMAVVKGARGVVHKSEPAEVILRAIEKVNSGEVWLNGGLLGEVLGMLTDGGMGAEARQADPDAERIASLTPREREIVTTMVRRAGAKQIAVADELGMSEHTLRNHLTTIYSKLGVRGRLELHVFATEHAIGAAPRVCQ